MQRTEYSAFVQGLLCGALQKALIEGEAELRPRDVHIEQEVDENGDYKPYFVVVTGPHRIRVTVEEESNGP